MTSRPGKKANGDGSVFKRQQNGRTVWIAQVSLGTRSNGKRRVTTRSAPTQKQAERLLRQLLNEHDKGQLTQVQHHTVRSYGLYWAREIKPLEVRASTAPGYEDLIRRYIAPSLGNKRLSELRAPDVQELLNTMKKDGYSTNTINQTRSILSGMCRHATRQGLMAHNPVLATDKLRRQVDEKSQVCEPWTLEEANKVLNASREDDDLDCFIHLMLLAGLRPGEALGIRWCDVDLVNGQLHITGTLKEARHILPDGSGVVRRSRNEPKTKASYRTLPVGLDLGAALARQVGRQEMWSVIEGHNQDEVEYVVTTRQGMAYYISNMRKKFYRMLKREGIRQIRLHDMRHTVARLALAGDARLEDVSQGLGHTRLDTTKQIYVGSVQRLNDRFGESVAALFASSPDRSPAPQIVESPWT